MIGSLKCFRELQMWVLSSALHQGFKSLFFPQEKEKERKKRMEAEKSKRKPVVDMSAGS